MKCHLGKVRRGLRLSGSYTVEAAFIFPLIVFVTAVMLYMIFYLHDRYVIQAYAGRMAQECCWQYIENEHQKNKKRSSVITGEVSEKYDSELRGQMLMVKITSSLGTCKKNILTQKYTASWRIAGEAETLVDTSMFHIFSPIVFEASSERVHIRQWIYKADLLGW